MLFLFSKVLFSANGKRFCFKSELAGSVHVFEGSVVKADVALLQKHDLIGMTSNSGWPKVQIDCVLGWLHPKLWIGVDPILVLIPKCFVMCQVFI